jgi:hypothetical protein
MAKIFNRAWMTITGSPGTGTITLSAAKSAAYCTFAEAGVANGDVVAYVIEDGDDFEIGIGTYTASGTTLSRDTVRLSKEGGAAGTAKINVSSAASVFILPAKEDLTIEGVATLNTEDQALTGGARITVKDLGNLSGATITPDPGDRPIQKITNNGAGTIAPGSNHGHYNLTVINTSGAGAITTSGWTKVDGAFDTTTTSEFLCSCFIGPDFSAMTILKVV